MIKKVILILTVAIVLVGCSTSKSDQAPTQAPVYNAEQIVNKLKNAGLPIDNIIVYTEETDVNGLLGKPNTYTSKVNFADTRVEQDSAENPSGGSVEVFESEEDMLARKDYIETVTKGIAFAQQFYFTKGCVLLRIDYSLSKAQANEYKQALDNLN